MFFGFNVIDLVLKFFYLFLLYKLYRFTFWLYKVIFRKRLNLSARYGTSSWALVTGATDGIGKAFTNSLAKEGFNIILVSRKLQKLKSCEDELLKSFPKIKVISLEFDFSKKYHLNSYREDFKHILTNYDVSILVNNVGTGESKSFLDIPLEVAFNTVVINTLPQVLLTRMFIDNFHKREKRSAIINLSSVAAIKPIANFALYSATKIFNHYLSRGLEAEMRSKIDFLSVKPFGVESNLSKMKRSFMIISADACSEGSLNCLGQDSETTGHWNHDIQSYLYSFIPFSLMSFIDIRNIFNIVEKFHDKFKNN